MPKTLARKMQIFRDSTSKNTSGFTLIEILVVVALIALITVTALPNLGAVFKINIGNASRELATTIRSVYEQSVLTGQTFRVVVDVEKNMYWVENGGKNTLALTAEQEEEEARRHRQRSDEEKKNKTAKFSLATQIMRSKKTLPKGVHFTDIITSRSKEPMKKGLAYAHVFPHGFIEKLAIHIKDDYDREATLIVNSVTGKSRLFQRYVKEID